MWKIPIAQQKGSLWRLKLPRDWIWDRRPGWPHQEPPWLPLLWLQSTNNQTLELETTFSRHHYSFGSPNLPGIRGNEPSGIRLLQLPHKWSYRTDPGPRVSILVEIGGREDVREWTGDEKLMKGRLEEGTDVGLWSSSLHCPGSIQFSSHLCIIFISLSHVILHNIALTPNSPFKIRGFLLL